MMSSTHVPPVEAPTDPQELAQAVGTVMYAGDAASQGLDMKVEEMAPGYARLTMRVRPDMLNGHKTCHGGFIFALADSTWRVSGDTPIERINESFGLKLSMEDFDTIGGMIAHAMGHVPKRGEVHEIDGLRFTVLHTKGGAVKWFKVMPVSPAEA